MNAERWKKEGTRLQSFSPSLAALLGLVEGLTEYLPVSSTGHLILVGHFYGFTGDVAASIDICIQLGAVLAVVVYEREKLRSLLGHAFQEQAALRHMVGSPERPGWSHALRHSVERHRNLWFLVGLGVAFLPAAVIGLLSHGWIEANLFSPTTVAISLIAGGIIILVVESKPNHVRIAELNQVGLRTALGVGLAQCVALVPGMSRSGSTIVGGLLIGLDRKVATEYSFFLALPTMFAATGYKLVQSLDILNTGDLVALALGLLVSFLVAWAVIALFLSYVKRHTLRVFAYYRIAFGSLLLFLLA